MRFRFRKVLVNLIILILIVNILLGSFGSTFATTIGTDNQNVLSEDQVKEKLFTCNSYGDNIITYQEIEKDGQSKILVQAKVSNIMKFNDHNDIFDFKLKNSNVEIGIVQFQDEYPESVDVKSYKMDLTRGQSEDAILQDTEWNYSETSKKVDININNFNPITPKESSYKWGYANQVEEFEYKDEYIITMIFSNNVYEALRNNPSTQYRLGTIFITNTIVYENSEIEIDSGTFGLNGCNLNEKFGNANTSIIDKKEISKGNMYANYTLGEEMYATEYEERNVLSVADKSLFSGEMVLEDSVNNFINYSSESKEATLIYKNLNVNINNFRNFLGDSGYIKIFDLENNQLCILNLDNIEDGQTDLYYEFPNNINKIKLVVSEPISNTNLVVKSNKLIKNDNCTRAEMLDINILNSKKSLTLNSNTQEISVNHDLKESYTDAKLEISQNAFSNVSKNEDVEFKIVLNNTNTNSNLYVNPVFEIVFPTELESINIKSVNGMFDNQLNIVSSNVIENNGQKVLKIVTQGSQSDFDYNSITGGMNIVVVADLTMKPLTPSIESSINLKYTNDAVTYYSDSIYDDDIEKGYVSVPVNLNSLEGIMNINTIENYDGHNGKIQTINTPIDYTTIAINDVRKTATVKVQSLNNYDENCNNVCILGRILSSDENENIKISTGVRAEDSSLADCYQVYYSDNKEATKDIADTTNNWTEDITGLDSVKSYLILFNTDFEWQSKSLLTFEYNVDIPANLIEGTYASTTFEVSYNRIIRTLVQESYYDYNTYTWTDPVYDVEPTLIVEKAAVPINLTTGEGVKVGLVLEASVANESDVLEEQHIQYIAKIKNSGGITARNLKVKAKLSDGLTYLVKNEATGEDETTQYTEYPEQREVEYDINQLTPNEEIVKEFEVKVNQIGSLRTVNTFLEATADNISEPENSNIITNNVIDSDIKIEEIRATGSAPAELSPGNEMNYIVEITNLRDYELANLEINHIIPKEMEFVEATKIEQYNSNNEVSVVGEEGSLNGQNVKWTLDKLNPNAVIRVLVTERVKELENNVYTKDIINHSSVSVNNKNYVSNEIKDDVKIVYLETKMISNKTNDYIKENDEIEYQIEVSNPGILDATEIIINDELPEGLSLISVKYGLKGQNEEDYEEFEIYDNRIEIVTNVNVGQTVIAKIVAKANTLDEDKKFIEVKNKAVINISSDKTLETNEIKTYIEKYPGAATEVFTYRISGNAWIDLNKNGVKEVSEEKLPGIVVKMYDKSTNYYVCENGQPKSVKTDDEGNYIFDNLPNGEYLVIFEYDSQVYTTTKYKLNGVSNDLNSDAVEKMIIADNVSSVVGISDIVTIKDLSVGNIDLGLINKQIFDMKIESYIVKTSVKNDIGIDVKEYDSQNIVKVEIPSKYIIGSNIAVEYLVKVTYTGTAEGYVQKIVNSLPQQFKFNSELNVNWYEDVNGKLYNSELSNILIKPGETKEIKLVATATITEDIIGANINKLEIFETYNEKQIEEKNLEDNKCETDLIISVKTGEILIYLALIALVIVVLITGVYYIKKRVL